ncbi:hypothetical protein D3C86_1981050 [compost metagenome]
MNKPKFGILIYFTKKNSILVNGISVEKSNLQNYLTNLESDKPNKFMFSFSTNMSFENYIQNRILITSLKLPDYNLVNEEFIF